MDVNRAREILAAVDVIDVQYEGDMVWIDMVDEDEEKAEIHRIENDTNEKVSVEKLHEIHSM